MKTTVTRSCGHEEEVVLYGPHADRDRKIEWMQDTPCKSCWRKSQDEKRTADSVAARDSNIVAGCNPLEGSEAQILWAEAIRFRFLAVLREVATAAEAHKDHPAYQFVVDTLAHWEQEREAKWWIDHRAGFPNGEVTPGMLLNAITTGSMKEPEASDQSILRLLLFESPFLTLELSKHAHLEKEFLARIEAAAAAVAKAEAKEKLMTTKPVRPEVLQKICAELLARGVKYYWNGKIYSGARIYVSETEHRLNAAEEKEVSAYQNARRVWSREMQKVG